MACGHFVGRAARVRPEVMFAEREAATRLVRTALTRSERQRAVSAARRALSAVRKISRLEATPQLADDAMSEFGPVSMRDLFELVLAACGDLPDIEHWRVVSDAIEDELYRRGIERDELAAELETLSATDAEAALK